MDRPSKKDIKAAIDKLKEKPNGKTDAPEPPVGKPTEKKSNMRPRKGRV